MQRLTGKKIETGGKNERLRHIQGRYAEKKVMENEGTVCAREKLVLGKNGGGVMQRRSRNVTKRGSKAPKVAKEAMISCN